MQEKPTAKLQLVGRIVDAAEHARIVAFVEENALQKSVQLPQPLPHAQTLQAIAGAHVLAAFSTVETFNMPVLEALALGTPVVTGDYNFQHEVAGEQAFGAAIFVDLEKEGDTPAALAIALYAALENPSITATLRKKGLIQAQKFNWETSAQTLAEGVQSV